MSISIDMNPQKWDELTVSLAKTIEKWSETIWEDYETGWWYDDVHYDMAHAGIRVLMASTKGQIRYREEEIDEL